VLHLCYTQAMSTKNPRIHTVLEPPLFEIVERLAKKDGHSLSEEAADLIREAVALREDRTLDLFAQARRKTFDPKKALTLGELRKRLKAR
jgi:hypothetical protein